MGRLFACFLRLSFLAGLLFSSSAFAQNQSSPQFTKGMQWLVSQVQSDGSLSGQRTSIALQLQARTETAQTLKLLAAPPTSLTSVINADLESNTEFNARKIISLSLSGWDVSAQVGELTKLQNLDGGFGGAEGYSSNPLDTAWAVLALAQSNGASSPTATGARAYLQKQIQSDGGVDGRTDMQRTLYSAITLMALQSSADLSFSLNIKNLTSWLLQRQGVDGGWFGDVYYSAYALLAVAPVTTDATVRNNAQNFFTSKQLPNGSWNEDPFTTSLVLRAISTQLNTPAKNTSSVKGRVVDQSTGQPIVGASVTLNATVTQNSLTDSLGNFSFVNLPAASYAFAVIKSGYVSLNGSAVLAEGQAYDLGNIVMSQPNDTARLQGVVLNAAGNVPLAGVTVTISGAVTRSVTTDASGRYELIGLPIGSAVISTNFTGFQSASANVNVMAGQTLVFSPLLYANNQNVPGEIHFVGQVVASGQGTPLAGVSIVLSGTAALSGNSNSQGKFDIQIPAGTYTATFSLAGYATVNRTFVAVPGSKVDASTVSLVPNLTKSSLAGRVLDTNGKAVNNATVQIVGSQLLATTGVDGTYLITNIDAGNFSVRVSAVGYDSTILNVQPQAPGDFQQDLILSAQSTASFGLGNLIVSPATIGSNADVVVNTTIKNNGQSGATVVLLLRVTDSTQKRTWSGSAFDVNNKLIGQIKLNPGEEVPVKLIWNSAQNLPGTYQLTVQIVEAGSISRTTPLGNVLIERVAAVNINNQMHFAGSVTANPPVLQAGTNTTVKLSAIVQNDGNTDLLRQAFTLNVVDAKDNSVAHTEQVFLSENISVNSLRSILFQDWKPTVAGSYRLELTTADASLGKVIGSVYVGDSAKAAYTSNKSTIGTGTQTVRATVNIHGQDVAGGVISDPLAPLVKAAIQKSVTYNDQQAANWGARNNCLGCHVQTQALVGGETNRRFATFDEGQRSGLYAQLKRSMQKDGSFYDTYFSYRQTSSMLAMWSLDSWHDKEDVAATHLRGAEFIQSVQKSDGHWDYDYQWIGKWTHAADHTALNVKSLIGLYNYIDKIPVNKFFVNYQTKRYLPAIDSDGTGALIRDQNDNLYITSLSGLSVDKVTQIKADGTVGIQWSGLQNPGSMVLSKGSDGILVATGKGLMKLGFDGSILQLNTNPRLGSLKYDPSGQLYSADYDSSTVYQIDDAGKDSVYLAPGVVRLPTIFSFNDAGEMLIPSVDNSQIMLVKKDKTISTVVTAPQIPVMVAKYKQGWIVGTISGAYLYDAQWNKISAMTELRTDNIVTASDGKVYFVSRGNPGIYQLVSEVVDPVAKRAQIGVSIDRASQWLQNLDLGSSANNLVLAHQLLGLGEAAKFYAGDLPRRDAIKAKMQVLASLLRSRQGKDGSWGVDVGYAGDAFVTAHVGYALDYLNPSPDEPYIRSAIEWLLASQASDGSWASQNNIFTSTNLATTTWVSIWLPVILDRLGGINTDLSLTFPANVTMLNPDTAPSQVTKNSDGSTTAIWNLKGVTSNGQSISFDTQLSDLQPGEVRPLSTDAHLTFRNSFTNGAVNAPIDIPSVTASAFMTLGLATDKVSYGADSQVGVSAQVTNTGVDINSGRVKFDVLAPDGSLISALGSVPFANLAAGAVVTEASSWNTARTLAGNNYRILATLYDSNDRVVTTASATFAITAVDNNNPAIFSQITSDKVSYLSNDRVQLTDRIQNRAVNQFSNNLQIITQVINPDGSLRFTQSETITQLAQNASKEYQYPLILQAAPAGQYQAILQVKDSGGTLLSQSATQFKVSSSSDTGSGLVGTMTAVPKQIAVGEMANFNFSVSNRGNTDLTGLALKFRVVDPGANKAIIEQAFSTDLKQTVVLNGNRSWLSNGVTGTTVVGQLVVLINGQERVLAQDNLTLIAPLNKLQGGLTATPRTLTLGDTVVLNATAQNIGSNAITGLTLSLKVSDSKGKIVFSADDPSSLAVAASYQKARSFTPGQADTYSAQLLSVMGNAAPVVIAQDSFTVSSPSIVLNTSLSRQLNNKVLVWSSCARAIDAVQGSCGAKSAVIDDPAKLAACDTRKNNFLNQYLTSQGVAATVVLDENAFIKELRQGDYDSYWISGAGVRQRDSTAMELWANAYSGAGLLVDGLHAGRNSKLDSLFGYTLGATVATGGKVVPQTDICGAPLQASQLPLSTSALQLQAAGGGKLEANYLGLASSAAAIVSNQLGSGNTLALGFDWETQLESNSDTRWKQTLLPALKRTQRQQISSQLVAGDILHIVLDVTNQGGDAQIEAVATLPSNSVLQSSSPLTNSDPSQMQKIVWTLPVPAAQSKKIVADIRIGAVGGDFSLPVTISSVDANGTKRLYKTETLNFTVKSADQLLNDVNTLVAAMSTGGNDGIVRQSLQKSLSNVSAALAQSDSKTALFYASAAVNYSERSSTSVKSRLQASLSQLMRALERSAK
ncbi:carboxypeptidase regulatory-like domain-containing protein [Undibacterium curvum]|uniref:carboxypeptidase regulatory-like domain-containing protein n=1 Tax=Undibacterium curvum TaxID=2762294 RepID=UPI003D122342